MNHKTMKKAKTDNKYLSEIKNVIKNLHEVDSKHIDSVPIKESFQGQTVWEGIVEVFGLIDHPKAKKCYAWSYKDDDKKTKYITVLELPPVISPRTAVQAAIVSEYKSK